jgi:signal transduction histidine kinase
VEPYLSQGGRREDDSRALLVREQAARRDAEAAEQQARARAEQAERRAELLMQAGVLLNAKTDYRAMLLEVARLGVRHLGDWCIVDLARDGGALERIGVVHRDPALDKSAAALVGPISRAHADAAPVRVLRTRAPEAAAVMSPAVFAVAEEHHPLVADLGHRAYVTVPLVAWDQALGAMTVVTATAREYTSTDIAVMMDLARRAALAVRAGMLEREGERRRNEFLSTLSHELRTPLTAMLGWLRLLRTGTLDPDTPPTPSRRSSATAAGKRSSSRTSSTCRAS